MKETRMPPAQAANLVANSGNTIYGVSVIQALICSQQFAPAGGPTSTDALYIKLNSYKSHFFSSYILQESLVHRLP